MALAMTQRPAAAPFSPSFRVSSKVTKGKTKSPPRRMIWMKKRAHIDRGKCTSRPRKTRESIPCVFTTTLPSFRAGEAIAQRKAAMVSLVRHD